MLETNHLKNAHYEAMVHLGYTDDEIDADWVVFIKEYQEFLDLTLGSTDGYQPFGSSIPVTTLSTDEKAKLDAFDKKELPW